MRRMPSWVTLAFGFLLGTFFSTTVNFHIGWFDRCPGSPAGPRGSEVLQLAEIRNARFSLSAATTNDRDTLNINNKKATFGDAPKRWNASITSHHKPKLKDNHAGLEFSTTVYLNGEFSQRRTLLLAILTSERGLGKASAIFDTWGSSAGDSIQLLFFVGKDCNASKPEAEGLPLVRLMDVPDHPQLSFRKIASLLKYLEESFFLEQFKWFMLALDDIYVRSQSLVQLLLSMDSSEYVYLGKGEVTARTEGSGNIRFCVGGPGIVLSRALLIELLPHVDGCVADTVGREREGDSKLLVPGDVALGVCLYERLGVQCSMSQEVMKLFMEKPVVQMSARFDPKLQGDSIYGHNFITYHPVSSAHALYQFDLKLRFEQDLKQLLFLEEQLNATCRASEVGGGGGGKGESCDHKRLCSCDPSSPKSPTESKPPPISTFVSNPRNQYELTTYEFFDQYFVFEGNMVYPKGTLRKQRHRKSELSAVLSQAVQQASNQYRSSLRLKKIYGGYVRYNPQAGTEYIVDMSLSDAHRPNQDIEMRVGVLRPMAANYLPLGETMDTTTTINFIVPVSGVNERFKQFMHTYEDISLKYHENTRLLVVVYSAEDFSLVNSTMQQYRRLYPLSQMDIVRDSGPFSRSRALHFGVSRLAPQELAFFCDVDMKIEHHFLRRCRSNTIRGARVYFPMFFKFYNMKYAYWNEKKPDHLTISRKNGHWASYSYGMVCVYKSDYDSVGGMDTKIVGWGEEDVEFFQKVLRKRLNVMRAPDTGLFHYWHKKVCPKSLNQVQYKHCLSSRGENLADRIELASYILGDGNDH